MCWLLLDAFGNLLQKKKKERNELREELASLQGRMKNSRDYLEIQRFVVLEEATVSPSQLVKYTIKKCFQQEKAGENRPRNMNQVKNMAFTLLLKSLDKLCYPAYAFN